MGIGENTKIANEITKISIPYTVSMVSTQFRHTIVLCRNGKLFGFGESRFGQLGIQINKKKKAKSIIYEPTSLFSDFPDSPIHNETIVSAKVGMKHSIFLAQSNSIWFVGDNKFSQLGDSSIASPCFKPICFQVSENVICNEIYCGWNHSVILFDSRKLILFGRNNYGQLGSSDTSSTKNELEFEESVKSISIGSEHCLVLLPSGKLYVWGWNEHGQLGLGNEENYYKPTLHPNLYSYISCGTAQCFGRKI